ncbi:MAG TPA: hypothetical protein VMQ81_03700 [Acidimicrobiia bacterium]|nr:hypothetical protein [Acidimicrobiia bacterium]
MASTDADGVPADTPPEGWSIPLDALAVDPADHVRFVSPRAAPLMRSLRAGEALLTEGSAELRGLGTGAELVVATGHVLTVAGVVDDASGAGAEVIVAASDAARLGIDTLATLSSPRTCPATRSSPGWLRSSLACRCGSVCRARRPTCVTGTQCSPSSR